MSNFQDAKTKHGQLQSEINKLRAQQQNLEAKFPDLGQQSNCCSWMFGSATPAEDNLAGVVSTEDKTEQKTQLSDGFQNRKGDNKLRAHPKFDPVLKDNSFQYKARLAAQKDEDMTNVKVVNNTGQVTSKYPDKYPAAKELFDIKAKYDIGDTKRNYVLIVEDMEVGYEEWVQYVIPETELLIKTFRELKLPIVWTNWSRRWDDGNNGSLDRFYGPQGIKQQLNPCFIYGDEKQINTIDSIKPLTEDEKSCEIVSFHLSKFADKDENGREYLNNMFKAWGVTTIILLGAWTDDCIAATAFEAVDRYGYDVIMVTDAVATATINGNKMRDCLQGSVTKGMTAQEIADFMTANPQLIDPPKAPLVGSVYLREPYDRKPEEFLTK